MTKILNSALKIKGGGRKGGTCEVLRPCHPRPKKIETCTCREYVNIFTIKILGISGVPPYSALSVNVFVLQCIRC